MPHDIWRQQFPIFLRNSQNSSGNISSQIYDLQELLSLEKHILAKNTYLKIAITNANYIDIHNMHALSPPPPKWGWGWNEERVETLEKYLG